MLWCESAAPPITGRFAKKVTFVSTHTKPAVLCGGVRVPHRRYVVGSQKKVTFVSAHTKLAVLCCGVRVPRHRCLFGLRNNATSVSAHTKPAVLNFPALGLPENSIFGLI